MYTGCSFLGIKRPGVRGNSRSIFPYENTEILGKNEGKLRSVVKFKPACGY
jgi:hypothetical protein